MVKNFPHERLEGDRVYLRRRELASAPAIFRAIDADRARLRLFLPWVDLTEKLADTEEYLRRAHVEWEEQKTFDFSMCLLGTNEFIGSMGAHTLSWEHERAELGYWVAGPHEGKGYVAEGVGILERELFRLGFHRIEIRCSGSNEKSAAVPRRCGYVLEGTLREHEIEHGARRDTLIFAKLRTSEK